MLFPNSLRKSLVHNSFNRIKISRFMKENLIVCYSFTHIQWLKTNFFYWLIEGDSEVNSSRPTCMLFFHNKLALNRPSFLHIFETLLIFLPCVLCYIIHLLLVFQNFLKKFQLFMIFYVLNPWKSIATTNLNIQMH